MSREGGSLESARFGVTRHSASPLAVPVAGRPTMCGPAAQNYFDNRAEPLGTIAVAPRSGSHAMTTNPSLCFGLSASDRMKYRTE